MLIQDLLYCRKDSNDVAIIDGDKMMSYKDWYSLATRIAKALPEAKKHSKIAIILIPNSINYAVAYFALLFAGYILAPITSDCTQAELLSLIKYCEAELILSESTFHNKISESLIGYADHVTEFDIDTTLTFEYGSKDFGKHSFFSVDNESDNNVYILLHTSGTLSNPKRVMLSHKNVISSIRSHIQSLDMGNDERTLIVLPMFFGYCNTSQFLAHLYLGGKIVIFHGLFHPKRFFEMVDSYGITNTTLVPSMLYLLSEWKGEISSCPRFICYGGGRTSEAIIKKIRLCYPQMNLVHTYGQTEASPRVTALIPWKMKLKDGSVGKPIPNVKIKIVTENGKEALSMEHGEICVQGDNVMLGYFRKEKETECVLRNGWLHTGDCGYLDNEGYLFICGRMKNVIISGGLNIYPEEIEAVLIKHSDILDVLVIGEKSDILGEYPVAYVVSNGHCTDEELKKYCKEYLSDIKIPKRFIFTESLPKTYNGKNKRRIKQ